MFVDVGRGSPHRTISQVASIAQQVNLYLLDYNLSQAPPTMTLEHLTLGADPYLRPRDLLDAWGNPCLLVIPSSGDPEFQIVSLGADGKPGGTGDNADIVN
jgi:general secretion pathway protein G